MEYKITIKGVTPYMQHRMDDTKLAEWEVRRKKNIVAAMFTVTPEQISLPRFDTVDVRSAVNKNVKARIIVKRPKWKEGWKATFTLLVDDDTITTETIKDLFSYAGRYVGIGSYRPTNNGSFGRFEIENIYKN